MRTDTRMHNVKARELALITSIIINEDVLGGTVWQTFDKAYEMAESFYECHDKSWQEDFYGLDYDEAILKFIEEDFNINIR